MTTLLLEVLFFKFCPNKYVASLSVVFDFPIAILFAFSIVLLLPNAKLSLESILLA
jgi:hypothetical protein